MRKFKTSTAVVLAIVTAAGVGTAGAAVAGVDATSATSYGERTAQLGTVQGGGAATATDRVNGVELQQGLVLEGAGVAGGLAAMVTVYENSLHGNSVQVVLGDPEDDRIGFTEGTEPFVVAGVLSVTVQIDGRPAVLSGTVQEVGKPEKVVEPQQDGGEQIVTRGTHTQLLVDGTLTYDGTSVPLEFAPAFAYELEVLKVSLYGR